MSRSPKQISISWTCVLVFTLHASIFAEEISSKEELLSTLEYILGGYEAQNPTDTKLRLQGKVLHEQRAVEGRKIPDNKIYQPKWHNFEFIQKEGKRRYEQGMLANPGKTQYALDNNRRLMAFSYNVVRIVPLNSKKMTWEDMTDLYGRFFRVSGSQGYDSLGGALRTLIGRIRSGEHDLTDRRTTIEVDEDGLFTIRVKRGIQLDEFTVDSRKGFNMVKVRYALPHEKFWVDEKTELEYTQLPNGQWVLTSGHIHVVEEDVIVEMRLESSEPETEFDVPDDIFEAESLDIPANVHTVDYHFSPPLEWNVGSTPDVNELDALLESEIDETQTAEVDSKGEINVRPHEAFVEHRERQANEDTHPPLAASDGKPQKLVFAVIFSVMLLAGAVGSVLMYRYLKGASRK